MIKRLIRGWTGNLMRTTLKDIAAAAEVTPAVVSAVLSGNGNIRCSKEKRALILDAVKRMNYRPNRAAQVLGRKSSRQIGVLHYSPQSPSIARVIGEVQKQLFQRGYHAIFGFWSTHEEAVSAFESVLSNPLDGLICAHNRLAEMIPPELPAVFFDRVPGRCCVALNYLKYIDDALAYLIGLGHRKIGYFGWRNEERFGYFKEKLAAMGGITKPEWNPSGESVYDSGLQMAEVLLQTGELPSALLCRNDILAFAVINTLRRHHLRVPEDVSVIGFDDIEAARYFYPSLTSFGASPRRIAAMLLDTLFAGPVPGEKLIDLELRARETCIRCRK